MKAPPLRRPQWPGSGASSIARTGYATGRHGVRQRSCYCAFVPISARPPPCVWPIPNGIANIWAILGTAARTPLHPPAKPRSRIDRKRHGRAGPPNGANRPDPVGARPARYRTGFARRRSGPGSGRDRSEGKSEIADHMVIASGRSTRQVASMAQKLAERIKHSGGRARIEGLPNADWVLLDAPT